ncbi:MAG TPA: uroporphyrinogen-III C-methyltransferase [Rhodanobacteraceae bacterium]|nr:uroporphyrinogen-III C-methyltransferase [Rhodanobacteraceae bacterium]
MNEVSADAAPRRRTSSLIASLALLLALLGLALIAWMLWQQRHAQSGADARATQLQARIAAVEHGESANAAQARALANRLEALDNDLRAGRDASQALDQRMHNLEAALGALSDQQLRGHDVLLLDDAEFLLVAGQQRLTLLHDADGALRACQLAAQALAHVQDPAFAPARQSTADECAVLARSAPQDTQALATLSSLRRQVPELQPIEPHSEETSPASDTWWSKFRHAFSGILRIRRDDATPLPVADAHLARELLQLDLAQAQAALLAGDQPTYREALARASDLLDTRFEKSRPAVRSALAELNKLAEAQPEAVIAPGNALAVLRGLRASHGLQSTLPIPATSTGGHRP